MPKSTGIDHVVLETSNTKELKKFFINVLGLKSYKDYGDEIFLKCGKQKLAIFKSKSKTTKLNHIAFKVTNLNKMKAKLKKLGYKLDKWDSFRGPGGIRVQMAR